VIFEDIVRRTPLALAGSAVLAAGSALLTAVPAHADPPPTPTKISAQLTSARIVPGQTTTLTGELDAQTTSSGWQPLAMHQVVIYRTPADGQISGTGVQVTTDDNGRYSYTFTAAKGDSEAQDFYATFNDPSTDAAYARAISTPQRLIEPWATSIHRFSASLDPYGNLAIAGCLTYGDKKNIAAGTPVIIEYSFNGRTGWKQHATVQTGSDCSFGVNLRVTYSGYWRARYLGDTNDQPATSRVKKAWRWASYFTGFKAHRSGRKVHVSGTLDRYFSATRRGGFPHRTVEVIFRFKGKSQWYHLAWAKTDSRGRFSANVHYYGSGSYSVIFQGSADTWSTWIPQGVYVRSVSASALQAPVPAVLGRP
jgi:5-hydroxyisourate hydrolase-like protein (transthyretin family)